MVNSILGSLRAGWKSYSKPRANLRPAVWALSA